MKKRISVGTIAIISAASSVASAAEAVGYHIATANRVRHASGAEAVGYHIATANRARHASGAEAVGYHIATANRARHASGAEAVGYHIATASRSRHTSGATTSKSAQKQAVKKSQKKISLDLNQK